MHTGISSYMFTRIWTKQNLQSHNPKNKPLSSVSFLVYEPYKNFCKICLSVFFCHTENAYRNCSVHNVVIDKVVLVWDGSPFQIETTCHAWVPASWMSLYLSWFLWIFVYLLIKTPTLINAIFLSMPYSLPLAKPQVVSSKAQKACHTKCPAASTVYLLLMVVYYNTQFS